MNKNMRSALAGLSLLTMVGSASAAGPLGLWMLTDGDNATDALIQGASVNTYAQAAGTNLQYAIQWDGVNGFFETIGRDVGGIGGVYDVNHNLVTTFTNFSTVDGQHLDGTLDTLRNFSYASNFSTGDVLRYGDGFFNTPTTSIWNGGAANIWSITYDAQRDSLFVGGANLITEIDTNGNFINSFATQDGRVRSLAYDRSDNTMWFLSDDGADAIQIDAAGNELSRMTVNLGGNYWGGEIAAVPEPATMAMLGLGAAAMLRRRKK